MTAPRPAIGPAQHFIAGRFCDSVSGAAFDVIDPATGRATTTAARGDGDDIEHAVAAARDSFEGGAWSRAKPAFRRNVLFRAADLIERRAEEISAVEAVEMGRPLGLSAGAHHLAPRAAWNLRFFAMEQELAGNEAFSRDDTLLTYTLSDPVGVFGLITPWNSPFMLSTWKIAPCLAYGNSAVHKPSELSPLSIRILAEVFAEAGMPDGVYNVVLGYGKEAGIPLVEHPDVVGVSFTGSRPTAQDIARRCADGLKRTSFELGGKSAAIVFADADLERAIATIAGNIFGNSGQMCVANSRLLVERPIYDEFLALLDAEARRWVPGDPFEETTTLGPLVSSGQYDRVAGYLEIAKREATIHSGGGRPDGLADGFFVQPTIVTDVDPRARICQEEIFGPVAIVLPFDTADEAVSIANDSSYGLAAYVWTGSQSTAHDVARRLQSGMIWINDGFDRDLRQPFGGVKQSGLGREGGRHSREFFTETRFVAFPTTPTDR